MVEQQTAALFEETKHIRQWTVNNDERQSKDSLAGIESALAFASDQAKFIGARSLHWNDDHREKAREKVEMLTAQRAEILSQIADERAKLSAEVKRRAEVVKALDEIYAGEKGRHRSEDREMPVPLFTEQDLRELETHAARRHDPAFYRTLTTIEREHDARSRRDPKEIASERFNRASVMRAPRFSTPLQRRHWAASRRICCASMNAETKICGGIKSRPISIRCRL